jgi:ATP adenylyltransferase
VNADSGIQVSISQAALAARELSTSGLDAGLSIPVIASAGGYESYLAEELLHLGPTRNSSLLKHRTLDSVRQPNGPEVDAPVILLADAGWPGTRPLAGLALPSILDRMDRLWTPWRYSYVTQADPQARTGVPAALNAWPVSEADDKHCVFCNMIAAVDYAIDHGMARDEAEQAAHIVYRGRDCFVCLNAYPYATGHMLIVPYQHVDSLAALPLESAHEMIAIAQRAERVLKEVYRPAGINMGLNLGEAAGAGIAGHIHLHALPRWIGDTNFMTVTAETRVLPESLDVTWTKLRLTFKI